MNVVTFEKSQTRFAREQRPESWLCLSGGPSPRLRSHLRPVLPSFGDDASARPGSFCSAHDAATIGPSHHFLRPRLAEDIDPRGRTALAWDNEGCAGPTNQERSSAPLCVFGALYLLALTHGLRQGEALGLQWRDVDLNARTLRVRHALQWIDKKPQLVETKTRQSNGSSRWRVGRLLRSKLIARRSWRRG